MDIPTLFALTTGGKTDAATATPTRFTETLKEVSEDEQETTAGTTQPSQAEEFDTFLSLLTAQIRNQDPLAPLDSSQFVDQLASFTSLELQAKGNAMLETIANLLAVQLQNDVPVTDDAEAA